MTPAEFNAMSPDEQVAFLREYAAWMRRLADEKEGA